MLYAGTFRRFPNIKFIVAHYGGALPVLSGRLKLLGTESWVPNSNNITQEKIQEQLRRLSLDTAAIFPDRYSASVVYSRSGSFGAWRRLWRTVLDGGDYGCK